MARKKKLLDIKIQNDIYNFSPIDVIGVFGRRGCGKSYLCKIIQKLYPRKFVFDTLAEYDEKEFHFVCHNFEEFKDAILATENKNKYRILVKFDIEESRKSELFEQMIRIIYYRGNALVVIEEIQNFCSPHFVDVFLENLFLTGRHQNLSVIFTTQRPATLNKKLFSQATKIFCGNVHTRGDIREVESHIGEYDIVNLKNREFIYWNPENGHFPIYNDLNLRK